MRYDRRRLESICWRAATLLQRKEVLPFPRDSADERRNLDGDYARAAQDDALVALIPGPFTVFYSDVYPTEIPGTRFFSPTPIVDHCYADNRLAREKNSKDVSPTRVERVWYEPRFYYFHQPSLQKIYENVIIAMFAAILITFRLPLVEIFRN